MLSVHDISERINNPALLSSSDVSALEQMTVKYPYAQLFSILYLKALSNAGDVRFESELRKHSFKISNRVQLYNLIREHEQQQVTSTEKAENTTSEVPEEAPTIVLEDEAIEKEEIISFEATPAKPETEDTTDKELERDDLVQESKPEETFEATPVELSEAEPEVALDTNETTIDEKLEESILHHSLAANYQLESLSEEEELALEQRKEESESKSNSEFENITTETEERVPATKTSSPSSFTGWLKSNSNYEEHDRTDVEQIHAVVNDFSEFDPSSDLFGEVEKPKVEFFSPTKKAKQSLQESELPVSETLAKIYIMQGNYPKAIEAYKQLSLAFPEKTIFFANLIEDLEKKINT